MNPPDPIVFDLVLFCILLLTLFWAALLFMTIGDDLIHAWKKRRAKREARLLREFAIRTFNAREIERFLKQSGRPLSAELSRMVKGRGER